MSRKKEFVRARDAEVRHFMLCSLFLLMGLTLFVFMTALCFGAKKAGTAGMMYILDGLLLIPLLGLPVCQLRMQRICRREYAYCRAAVETDPYGKIRLEYFVEPCRYVLEIKGTELRKTAGPVGIWYDIRNPRRVFFGNVRKERPSYCGWVNFGMVFALCGGANLVFALCAMV